MSPPIVVKVGGSLYDLPDLGARLTRWLDTEPRVRSPVSVILVPGGGPTTDAIRYLDRNQHLGEESAHWLALHALSLNAQFLAYLLPKAIVTSDIRPSGERLSILDALTFVRADEEKQGRIAIPHSWDAGSDCVAVRVAAAVRARWLILLKSATIPLEVNGWEEASRHGFVDAACAAMLRTAAPELEVCCVNLREWQP